MIFQMVSHVTGIERSVDKINCDLGKLEANSAKLEASLKTDMNKLEASFKTDMARLEANTAKLEASLKTDMNKLEGSFKTDTAELEASLKSDMGRLEANILKAIDKQAYVQNQQQLRELHTKLAMVGKASGKPQLQ
jgi:hypothetical protein